MAPNCFRCAVVNCVSRQREAAGLEPRDEMDERHLRGIARGENMLSPKNAAPSAHAVEPADEPAVLPGLDGVAMAESEELAVEPADAGVDPGLWRGRSPDAAQPSITARNSVIDAHLEGILPATVRASRRGT